MLVGAARAQGVTCFFSFAKKEGTELLQQHGCAHVVHTMPFPADVAVQVKHASRAYDFEHETRETDKKNMQHSLHEKVFWDFLVLYHRPQGLRFHFCNLFSV